MGAQIELEGELRTWVEVIIEDPVAGENLLEQVRSVAEGKDFDVVRVVCSRPRNVAGIGSTDLADAAGEESLLEDPAKVFALRLDREEAFEEGERESLELLFRQVLEHHQQEGGAD